jgi:hypothetical protein
MFKECVLSLSLEKAFSLFQRKAFGATQRNIENSNSVDAPKEKSGQGGCLPLSMCLDLLISEMP